MIGAWLALMITASSLVVSASPAADMSSVSADPQQEQTEPEEEEEAPDILCLQETKMQKEQADFDFPGYFEYWNSATTRKGYSGTAIFSKKEPLSVTCGMGLEEFDGEGRVIAAEYVDFILVTVYTPNSQRDLVRIGYRMQFEDASGSTSPPCGRKSRSSSAGT